MAITFEERTYVYPDDVVGITAVRQGNRMNFNVETQTETYVLTVTKQQASSTITNLENLIASILETSHIAVIGGGNELRLLPGFLGR